MVSPSQIGWGSYQAYEGPWFKGSVKYVLPDNPNFGAKLGAVITATEGGMLDAWNGYDVCIATGGFIQWCNRAPQRSVDRMLAAFHEVDAALLDGYLKKIDPTLTLAFDSKGEPHLMWNGSHISTMDRQKAFWLGGSTGLKGQWTAGQKSWARHVAAGVASILAEPAFHQAQLDFTVPKLLTFATSFGVKELFEDGFPTEGWEGAFRAIYISYAANMPAVIARLWKANRDKLLAMDAENRCIAWAKICAFSTGIAIYPQRYNHIRKTVEELFGVDLPDFANELRTWEASLPEGCESLTKDPKAIQQALIDLGYDLGPSGADGKIGPKSQGALRDFQKRHGLVVDGVVGPKTLKALSDAINAKNGTCG